MDSALVSILRDELRRQRTFLSTDEEEALARPASYQDEHDLALDRVKHRRLVFYGALRDRFIREGRPVAAWSALIDSDEAAAGEPTVVSELATQVLEWAARTSDRGAMFGGFAAKTLRWAGIVLLLFSLWAWYQGAPAPVAITVVVVALVLLLAARVVGGLAADRAALLAQRARQPASPATRDGAVERDG